MRLLLVIHSLAGGGSERVMSRMANHWAERGVEVTILTLNAEIADAYPVHHAVRRMSLPPVRVSRGVREAVGGTIRRVRLVRERIRTAEPDAIVSFIDMTNVLVMLAAARTGVPVVVSERTYPPAHTIHPLFSVLRRLFYRRAAALVVQTQRARGWALRMTSAEKVRVIPNPSPTPPPDEGVPDPWEAWPPTRSAVGRVVAIGRFTREKGFDLLLEAFGRVAGSHPGWVLAVVGEGPERAAIARRAADLGLEERVWIPGHVEHSGAVLAHSDVFVLPSRYEGFPNVLLEAMARGVPVVAADCPAGPAEIVRHGTDGVLVPPEDVGALAEALDSLMGDADARRRLGAAARDVTERFSVDRVMAMWDDVIAEVRR